MKRLAIALIRFYQRWISPIIPPTCRFEPTCSSYTIEAIQKKGFVKGSLMGAWRILRCNPFCKGGYDPVDPDADRAERQDEAHGDKPGNRGGDGLDHQAEAKERLHVQEV